MFQLKMVETQAAAPEAARLIFRGLSACDTRIKPSSLPEKRMNPCRKLMSFHRFEPETCCCDDNTSSIHEELSVEAI